MVNYEKSIIYKLCCKDPSITDEYVGSTVNFTRRKSQHKSNCCTENNEKYNFKVYQKIRECGGWENWDMVEVERYCAEDRKDLHSRERFWLEELGATLNNNVPDRSAKEWRQDNKEKMSEYFKVYRIKNLKNKIEYDHQYYGKNKEQILKYQNEYRQKNKTKIAVQKAEKGKVKVTCECGCSVRRDGLTRHRKNIKHKKLMINIEK